MREQTLFHLANLNKMSGNTYLACGNMENVAFTTDTDQVTCPACRATPDFAERLDHLKAKYPDMYGDKDD